MSKRERQGHQGGGGRGEGSSEVVDKGGEGEEGQKREVRDERVEEGTWERRGGFRSGSGCSGEQRGQGW